MKIKHLLAVFTVILSVNSAFSQDKKFKVHTVAFYNLENFYDTINDPDTRDDEWVYDKTQFKEKQNNIAKVLSEIGSGENKNSPTIIGLCEVENREVLEALVKNPKLIDKDYGIIHFDSPDRRGIDNALIYQKKYFVVTSYVNIPLMIYEKDTKTTKKEKVEKSENGEPSDFSADTDTKTKRIYTRDQLLVTGLLEGEEISFIVNHWPSRRGGEAISSPLRELAANLNKKVIDSLYKINPNAKVITMGDLNDGPFNNSVKKVLGAKEKKEDVKPFGFYNPMMSMSKKGIGTLAYRDAWDLFDQMILTEPLIRKDYSSWTYWKAGVFNKPFMYQTTGQYKGYALRNSLQGKMGYSDHFPVYVYLIKEVK